MTRKSVTHLPPLSAPSLRSPAPAASPRSAGTWRRRPNPFPGRRRHFLLLIALACLGQPAWSDGLAERGLDDPQVRGDVKRCFLCNHQGFAYSEPESDAPRQSRPEPQPEPEVCE